MKDDLSDNERQVYEWASGLHKAVWKALCEAMDYQRGQPEHDLPPEFISLEWLLDGDRWEVVQKAVALNRPRVQTNKYKRRKREIDNAFREQRRVYMRAYRANLKKKESEPWRND